MKNGNQSIVLSSGSLWGGERRACMYMAMYAVAITPLIHCLTDESIKQVWFAYDASAGGGGNA